MARDEGNNDWGTESRLERQNSVNSDSWSRLPGDSGYDEATGSQSARRRRAPQRSWLRTLALPVIVCVALGGLAIYMMSGMVKPG